MPLVLLLVGFGGVVVAPLLVVVGFFGWPDIGCSASETQSLKPRLTKGDCELPTLYLQVL